MVAVKFAFGPVVHRPAIKPSVFGARTMLPALRVGMFAGVAAGAAAGRRLARGSGVGSGDGFIQKYATIATSTTAAMSSFILWLA